ncbi:MAG: hypothetical protein AAF488_08565 [Planctomycetota bacterium]
MSNSIPTAGGANPRSTRGAWLASLALLAALSSLTGCAAWSESLTGGPVRGVETESTYQPSDFPVPIHFDFDESESWTYLKFADPPLNIRSGKFVYYGDRPVQEVSHWFLDQMPVEGWTHVESQDRDDIRMTFRKGRENAEIHLERVVDDNGEYFVTRLTARIRPAGTYKPARTSTGG